MRRLSTTWHLLLLTCLLQNGVPIWAQSPCINGSLGTYSKPRHSSTTPAGGITSEDMNVAGNPDPVTASPDQGDPPAVDSRRPISDQVVFLSPRDGAVVGPGETVHFELSIAPGAKVEIMALISDLGVSEMRRVSPFSFTLSIPEDDRAVTNGPLIGKHVISAFGKIDGNPEPILALIELDVEMPALPIKLSLEPGSTRRNAPEEMHPLQIGTDEWLRVYVNFQNRKEFNLTESTHIEFRSGDPRIIRVSDRGTVTAVGPGKASVAVIYSLGKQSVRLLVPVIVEN
jgi:hypothetical protein